MARPPKKERNKLIRRLKKEGKTYRAIGEMLGIHWTRVYQVLNPVEKVLSK